MIYCNQSGTPNVTYLCTLHHFLLFLTLTKIPKKKPIQTSWQDWTNYDPAQETGARGKIPQSPCCWNKDFKNQLAPPDKENLHLKWRLSTVKQYNRSLSIGINNLPASPADETDNNRNHLKGIVAWVFCPLVLFINRPHSSPCLIY